jgi:hypothetical protein
MDKKRGWRAVFRARIIQKAALEEKKIRKYPTT